MLVLLYPITLKWRTEHAAHETTWAFNSEEEQAEAVKHITIALGTFIDERKRVLPDSVTTQGGSWDERNPYV